MLYESNENHELITSGYTMPLSAKPSSNTKMADVAIQELTPFSSCSSKGHKEMPQNDGPTKTDLLQNQVILEVQNADHFITNTEKAFNNTVNQLLGAALTASRDYDIIMKAQPSKPLFGEILGGVILTLFPSLEIFKTTFVPDINLATRTVRSLMVLEAKFDDLTKNFIDPLSEKDETEKNVAQEQAMLAASNSSIKAELGTLYDLSQRVTAAARKARRYIRKKSQDFLNGTDTNINLLRQIQEDFKNIGITDISPVGKHQFLMLSDKILYDMLRKYVETYVVFRIVDRKDEMNVFVNMQYQSDWYALQTRRIADLPQYRSDYFIQGIDEAKRNAIYDKFKNGVIGDIKRPGVKDYKDLIRYWKAGTVGTSGAKLFFN